MTVVVDTSVIVDVLRGSMAAAGILSMSRETGRLHASEVVRLEVLAGTRPHDEAATRAFLAIFDWHPVDEQIAEIAGDLGRRWLPDNHSIDTATLAVAATALALDAELLTTNTRHFPMFDGLSAPY